MIRRIPLFLAAALLLVFTASFAMAALTATETIQQRVDEALNIIKGPKMSNPATRGPLLQQVEDKIKTIFDFTEFSARTVGPKWRAFTDEQKNRFEDAFASLLRATYIEKLDGYNGEKVKFLGEIKSTKGDKVEVQTSILMKDKEVPVSYRLLDKDGIWKVYDVRIEKVSLIENYRGQFKEILMKGDTEELIKKVVDKAAEMKQQNNAAR
jgi:phospholipid transport system substrate-binding protein